ncbi:hypothetical protein WN48_09114 [Eufriesea mexicana]|uniref:Uncharacterized protein n=1 Tax=Eufriesea mexicana TaxID=516756 RepID=A0A310SAS2_9HYME|nr:hypothetical protein WN48_09114 [Eufriesea mexicana]
MIPPTMHGHEFNQPLSRVVMVRKTDQRTFSKGRRGGEPLLETVTRETVELFNGGRAERKYTSETRDIVTPKSNRYVSFSLNYYRLKGKSERNPRLPGTQMKCYVRRACSKDVPFLLPLHFAFRNCVRCWYQEMVSGYVVNNTWSKLLVGCQSTAWNVPLVPGMPSLSVHGTKKKVVGFVDQLSPERYSPMVCRLVAEPSADPNEAEQRVNKNAGRFDGVRDGRKKSKTRRRAHRLYVVALFRASLGSVNGLSLNSNDVGDEREAERKFLYRVEFTGEEKDA